jgi:Tol biopolymer transport system component
MTYKLIALCLATSFSVPAVIAQQNFGRGPRVVSILEVYDMSTGSRKVVKEFNGTIEAPNWTPDGKWLVYNSNGQLYRISPDLPGASQEAINTDYVTNCNNDHVISVDGKFIALSSSPAEDRRSRVYVVPIEGGVPRLVTPIGPSYLHGISPDNNFLAYCADRNGNYDIYVTPTLGGRERRLTTTEDLDDGPEYSPDGKHIWFNSVRTGLMQVWRMKADGSEQTQMTFDQDRNSWFPHVSPDGKQIVYITYRKGDLEPNQHLPNKNVELRMMPAAGGTPKTVVELFGGQGTINVNSWAPDSRRFAFVSYRLETPTTPVQIPAQFTGSGDVGAVKSKGSYKYDPSTGRYSITGGGENLWAQADEFYYVWRKDSTDFTFSATLAFNEKEGNAHKKMGLMIRESLDPDAKYVDIAIHADGLTSLQYRSETGGITREITTLTKVADHVVLIRKGTKLTMRTATGATPRQDNASIEIDFPGEYYTGMFVCAHEAGVTRTADFSEVRFIRQQ